MTVKDEIVLYRKGLSGEWAEKPGFTRDWTAHRFVKHEDVVELVHKCTVYPSIIEKLEEENKELRLRIENAKSN